jgi:hypothetical protein
MSMYLAVWILAITVTILSTGSQEHCLSDTWSAILESQEIALNVLCSLNLLVNDLAICSTYTTHPVTLLRNKV